MEQTERPATGVSRSQHVLHVVPQVWDAIVPVVTGALERVDPDATEPQLLVVTPDADTAMDVARLAAQLPAAAGRRILPVSEGGRAARLLRDRPAPVVVGAATALAELLGTTALKLEGLKAVLLIWADEVVERTPAATLDALFTEIPHSASRLATAGSDTPELEEFVERQMFRARRAGDQRAPDAGTPIDVDVLTTSPSARPAALARLFDELDPPSAVVVARTEEGTREARETLALLGYPEDGDVRVLEGVPDQSVALAVLYEVPMRRDEIEALREAGAQRIVALASARESTHLRALLAGGKARPLQLAGPAKRARAREERIRNELRAQLEAGVAARDLIALEPLTTEWDALEVAAAALRLMERARQQKAVAGPAAVATEAARGGNVAFKRVFMTLGTMDGAAPRDVVGAILNEAGLSKEQVGKVEMRDSHTLVEVDAEQVERVASVLDGKSIRGRRINARPDMDRSERESRPPRGDRPVRDRGDRPARAGGDRPMRDRGERPQRSERPSRGDRPERPFRSGGERPFRSGGERPFRSGGERPARGERPFRSGGDRPARPERPFRSGTDRPARSSDRPAGDRPGGARPPRRDHDAAPRSRFGGEPREAGGERVDWSERAERLRRAKRAPRQRPEGGWTPEGSGE